MAIKLTDKPNTDPVDGSHPYGNIKDNSGSNDGTPVNKLVYADMHQFFEKMMDSGSVVHNGLPDNATNNFQLFEALLENIRLTAKEYTNIAVTVAGSFTVLNPTVARLYADNTVAIAVQLSYAGTISSNTTILSGLPQGFSLWQTVRAFCSGDTNQFADLLYSGLGNSIVTGQTLPDLAASGNTNLYFYVEYKKTS